jgi:hypothetical protein
MSCKKNRREDTWRYGTVVQIMSNDVVLDPIDAYITIEDRISGERVMFSYGSKRMARGLAIGDYVAYTDRGKIKLIKSTLQIKKSGLPKLDLGLDDLSGTGRGTRRK